jgi:hypothetical protein
MQNKNSEKNLPITFDEIKNKSKFWLPVYRDGWWIKFSTYRDTHILLTIHSHYTSQTIIRYFDNENSAVDFINFITDQQATKEIPNL